jgi:hypothetical protein
VQDAGITVVVAVDAAVMAVAPMIVRSEKVVVAPTVGHEISVEAAAVIRQSAVVTLDVQRAAVLTPLI